STSFDPLPSPTPAKLWSVLPPIWNAAIPVDAVIWISSDLICSFSLSALMISRKSTDLPVPADPVINMLS
ncbi:hypothetical protein BX070DRAFT_184925, partial [Coemansia spiralis]